MRGFLDSCGPTQHLIGSIRIQIDGDTARSSCYVQAIHASREVGDKRLMLLWGEYQDQLQRTACGWKIRHRRLRVQHIHGDIGVALRGV
ncbi:SnoaL-like domain protein [compost metagenome]